MRLCAIDERWGSAVRVVGGILLCLLLFVSCGFFSGLAEFNGLVQEGASFFDKIECVFGSVPPFIYLLLPVYPYFLLRAFRASVRRDAIWAVPSLLVALAIVTSCALGQTGALRVLYATKMGVFFACVSLVTLSCFVFTLAAPLARYLGSSLFISGESIVRGRYLIVTSCVLLACWMPYLIAFAPGSTCYDMLNQLLQFSGGQRLTSHHPLVSTIIYGNVFFGASSLFGGANMGLLAIVLFQTVGLLFAVAYELSVIRRLGAPGLFAASAVCFFAIVPVFGAFCQWAVKDTLFVVAFTVYATAFIEFVNDPSRIMKSKADVSVLVVSAIFVGLLRNNGFYVVLLSLPFTIAFLKKGGGRRCAIGVVCATILVIPCVNNIAIAASGAEVGSVREMLSIPFQQTARYASEHPDDVQLWEREAIDAILGYDSLADRYNSQVSDPVKGGYKSEASMTDYFAAWASQGMRHPLSYVEATAIQTYGYWSVQGHITYNREFPEVNYYWGSEEMGWGPWLSVRTREFAESAVSAIANFPGMSLLTQIGFYAWLLLFEATYLVYRGRGKYLIALLPCIVLLLTCIAGPLNGSVRYGFGLMSVAPLMLYVTYLFGREKAGA